MKKSYTINNTKYLNSIELTNLETLLKMNIHVNTRDCLLILLALKTGARAQEILNITKSDIDTFNQSVFIRGLKGSNDRETPLNPVLFSHLIRYMNSIETDRIFDISYDRLYQIWLEYRPVKKKFHSLRHTMAIELYKKTKDLLLVKTALGHKSILNTMVYQSHIYTQDEMKRMIL